MFIGITGDQAKNHTKINLMACLCNYIHDDVIVTRLEHGSSKFTGLLLLPMNVLQDRDGWQ